jgi:hypothetical protein
MAATFFSPCFLLPRAGILPRQQQPAQELLGRQQKLHGRRVPSMAWASTTLRALCPSFLGVLKFLSHGAQQGAQPAPPSALRPPAVPIARSSPAIPPTRTSISFSCCSPQSSLLVSSPSRAGQPTPLPFFFHGRELQLACYGRPDFSPSSLASLAQGSHGRAPLAKVLLAVASSSLRSASPTRRPCCRRAAAPCPWRPYKSSPSSPCSSPCCSAGNAATALHSTPARAPFLAVRRGARRLFVKMRSKPRAAGSLFREALWTARHRRSPWVAVFAQPLCRRRSPPVRPRRFMFDSASGYFFPMINCVCAV